MAANRFIIWGSGSGPAWRVLIALEEKQLEYESRLIEFSKGEHKSTEVLALNPRGQVPVLKDGDVVVNESLAAVQYLEHTYSNNPLVPKDAKSRALVLQRFHEASNFIAKATQVGYPKMRNLVNTPEEEAAWLEKVEELKAELKFWESYVAGGFVAGSEFSIADISLAPFLLSVERYGGELKDFPNLKKYAETLKARPSIAKTFPPHWKTSPNQTWLAGLI
ncbi:hypothetical protein WJX72_009208 [[Myrmecia] bisecta]|uniref:Glutathione S-transferase n=1 Tax=[Myrmecia] bisecta TaxID=41462 RepID=A0AAW1QB64_9CHLO